MVNNRPLTYVYPIELETCITLKHFAHNSAIVPYRFQT